jgi:predicted transcriptional regulator
MNSPVSEVMEEGFPVVDEAVPLGEVANKLHSAPAVLVEEYKRIIGIITRIDVLDTPR